MANPLSRAVKIRPSEVTRANEREIRRNIYILKNAYKKSSQALARANLSPSQLKTIQERIDENPSLYNRSVVSLNVNELRQVYSTYRNYFYTDSINNNPAGFLKSSTVKGYKSVLKEQEERLGIKGYASKRWTEEQRSELWNLIKEVENLGPAFFNKRGIAEYLFTTDRNYARIATYIEDLGITDPQELLNRLQNEINNLLINEDNDLLNDEYR